jgi:hypothetical protein
MRLRGWIVALGLLTSSIGLAVAQGLDQPPSGQQYVPRLGDIMSAAQTRHDKLWLAAKAGNWELAGYELRQLKAGLVEAAMLYSGIPASNVTTLAAPLQSVAAAIDARDGQRFARSFGELTEGCNSCHRAMGRGFIVMREPAEGPFGNQVFPPRTKP